MKKIVLTANEIRYIQKLMNTDSASDNEIIVEDEEAWFGLREKLDR